MTSHPSDAAIFRALLESSGDNLFFVDREGRYVQVSRSGAAAVGLTPDEMIGRTWRELGLPAEVMLEVERQWHDVFESGETRRHEVEYVTPQGRRWFEYVLFPAGDLAGVTSRDITHRATTADLLTRSAQRYRSFVANSSEAIWRFEIDEPIDTRASEDEQIAQMFARAYLAECNVAMANMYGYDTPDDLVGTRLREMLDPSQQKNVDYLKAFIRSGYSLADAESVELDRFGNRKYFVNSLTGLVEHGWLVRAWGMQRDATEERNANELLRLSQQRLQALVAASTQTVWTAVGEGELTWVAPSWTELTGQTIEEARGHGWLQMIHPEDRESDALPFWREAVEHQSFVERKMRIRARDGSYRWFAIRAVPLRADDGGVREWIGSNTDIDVQHREAEAMASRRRNAEFLTAANDLFVRSLDYEQTLRNLAQMAVPLLADWCAVDMIEPDGTLRRLAVEHSDPDMVKLAYEMAEKYPSDRNVPRGMHHVIRTGETDWMADIPEELVTASARSPEHAEMIQRLRLRSWISAPIRVRQGVAGVLTLVNADSSRRFDESDVRLANELAIRAGYAIDNARLYQQAVEANRAKDEFLATLSHELRTPLTSILGWASLLRHTDYDAASLPQAIQLIEQSARTQAALIDDLLDVSRVITGKLQLHVVRLDAARVIENGVASIQPAAAAKKLDVRVDTPPDLEIRADANRLQQIVWNLLSNAVKFSHEGGRIDVTLKREDDFAVIRVRDEGVGIASDVLPRVFDRFWQADTSSHRTQGGLGLGLAIVKHLTELHGGTASVDSEGLGHGTTFTVRLPVG